MYKYVVNAVNHVHMTYKITISSRGPLDLETVKKTAIETIKKNEFNPAYKNGLRVLTVEVIR